MDDEGTYRYTLWVLQLVFALMKQHGEQLHTQHIEQCVYERRMCGRIPATQP